MNKRPMALNISVYDVLYTSKGHVYATSSTATLLSFHQPHHIDERVCLTHPQVTRGGGAGRSFVAPTYQGGENTRTQSHCEMLNAIWTLHPSQSHSPLTIPHNPTHPSTPLTIPLTPAHPSKSHSPLPIPHNPTPPSPPLILTQELHPGCNLASLFRAAHSSLSTQPALTVLDHLCSMRAEILSVIQE